jgi:hypothetical protein
MLFPLSVAEQLTEREQLEQLSVRVRELAGDVARLEALRIHPMSGPELVGHEGRLSIKRRQLAEAEAELDVAVAAHAAVEAERREEREAARAAARPELERQRAQLQTNLTRELLEIERLGPELAAAVHAALAADGDLLGVEHELGLRAAGSSRSGWTLAIENRLGFLLLGDLGSLDGLSRPLGLGGRDPLASTSTCKVCNLPANRRNELETALASGSLRQAAKQFGLARSTLSRHRREHLSAAR